MPGFSVKLKFSSWRALGLPSRAFSDCETSLSTASLRYTGGCLLCCPVLGARSPNLFQVTHSSVERLLISGVRCFDRIISRVRKGHCISLSSLIFIHFPVQRSAFLRRGSLRASVGPTDARLAPSLFVVHLLRWCSSHRRTSACASTMAITDRPLRFRAPAFCPLHVAHACAQYIYRPYVCRGFSSMPMLMDTRCHCLWRELVKVQTYPSVSGSRISGTEIGWHLRFFHFPDRSCGCPAQRSPHVIGMGRNFGFI